MAMAGVVVVAVSPSLTWFRGHGIVEGCVVWLRAVRGSQGARDRGQHVDHVVMVRGVRLTPTRLACGCAVTALWTLGAAGLTGASGIEPGGDIGGLGIRA